MILQYDNRAFVIHTAHTTYAFRVHESGQLEHLYYGKKLHINRLEDIAVLIEKHKFAPGNTNLYQNDDPSFSLEDMRLEMSSYGKGDIREPFIEVVHADGSYTSDFVFDSARILDGKEEFHTLPGSYDEDDQVEQLCVVLKDKQYHLRMHLHYYVYEESDVITRSAVFYNDSDETVNLKRLMSLQLDFEHSDYIISTFHGAWAREMRKHSVYVNAGKYVNSSYTGTSSSRSNPFVIIGNPMTTESHGECYGLNLIYSGNHYEAFEANSFGKLRVVSGINPASFSYQIASGEMFEAPEAVMVYANQGYQQMSHRMHHFIREHIVRGSWKKKTRPVLLNSWEAFYFKINEKKLLKLAQSAKDVGMELFVMDDGWYGQRDDDTSSLGDWDVNLKKLPNGLKGLGEKIESMGLKFGIWVEPEMVSVKSNLYLQHPDWALAIPGKPHSEGRNQRILDLTRTEVQDFVIEKMTEVFSQGPISYVKWDMNRTVTDCFSPALPADRQGEVFHRYMIGLYRCFKELTSRFPDILFEGCASGGNRFDLGMLCYFPQIWASDNTDALCRAEIQNGYSYGYPMSVISAHVSGCPNHQTLRTTPLETRYHVAAFGVLGYELNLQDLSQEERQKLRAQIENYKAWRETLQWGDFYRGRSFVSTGKSETGYSESVLSGSKENYMEWTCVSGDRKKAVGMLLQKLVYPNTQQHIYHPRGLDEENRYRFYNIPGKHNIMDFGSLINTVSPIHIREHSQIHHIVSKVVKMDEETENYSASGDLLMYGGVHLSQAFGATGYDDDTRHFPDFASRIYYMEAEE